MAKSLNKTVEPLFWKVDLKEFKSYLKWISKKSVNPVYSLIMNIFKNRKQMTYKFLVLIIPLVTVSIIITSIVLSIASYTFFKKTIEQDYRNIINSSAGEIRLFIENAQNNLDNLALLMAATKLDKWQKEIALTSFLHTNTQFITASICSTKGKIILTTIQQEEITTYSDKEIFQKALAGKSSISSVMMTKEEIPILQIAVPVFHLGKVKEIIWAEVNLKSIWDVLKGITIGRTGQIYIMDLSGKFLAHKKIDNVVRTPPVEQSEILKKLRESNTTIDWIEKKSGSRLYCMGIYVPALDWIIALSQPVTEIYEYLYQNIFWAVCMTCFICIATVMLGWKWIRGFLAPVHTLHHQVQKISQGELDEKISVDSEDEIGDLGHAFNKMTVSLKKQIDKEIVNAKELVHAQNLALLGETSSKVTHEVRNLLNNIGITLTTLQREPLTPKGVKVLGILEKESTRVREFISNFLQFAKKPELRLRKMPMDIIIKEAIFLYYQEAKKRQIQIDLQWDPDLPRINVDSSLMNQVINNLVKNSFEAMSNQGIISIKGEKTDSFLVIKIQDSGLGLEPDIQKHIFDPFFSTKGKEGTGLGMSIVKTIVAAHRGTIECNSKYSEGTIFTIHLPLT